MNSKRLLLCLQLTTSLLLVACGGSGSDAGAPPFGGGGGGGAGGGGGNNPPPAVADLSVSLDKLTVGNSGTESVAVTVTAVDAQRNALPDVPITVSADSNAVVIPGGTATGTDGRYQAVVSIGADRTNRVIALTVRSGSLERSAAFQVVGARIASTALPGVVTASTAGNKVEFRVTDSVSNPMINVPIAVEAPGLATVNATTGVNGEYTYNYTAPATAGTLTITGRAAGVSQAITIQVQGSGGTNAPGPVTQAILSASVSANPSVVPINEGISTTNRSEVRALFLGANNAPIQNVRVKFDLNGDANSIGGSLSSGTSVVYSDVNGVANVSYVPASRSSPTDGVTVRACYGATEAEANGCGRFALTTLTVTSEPLSVSIGFNNEIESGAGNLTYIKKFVVLVVDASGRAKPDVQITPSLDLVAYVTGSLDLIAGERDINSPSRPWESGTCRNEDINRNGVRENSEDDNNNGQLDPRKSDVTIRVLGNGKTSENGTVVLQIEYPESVGLWLRTRILVAASGISGTEGRTDLFLTLPVSAEDFNSTTATPAFFTSPYGRLPNCGVGRIF